MKFRTVIEVITDADNKIEATDIAGEFLKGEFETGVKMKCHTMPTKQHLLIRSGLLLSSVLFIAGMVSFGLTHNHSQSVARANGVSACQPPLKTGRIMGFKEEWRDENNKKTLDNSKE